MCYVKNVKLQNVGEHIQCSVCRNKQKYQEISYIKAGNTVTNEDCIKIKGNYSTKIEAVIKLLLELKNEDPNVKVLLFSSWASVLKCLKEALEMNDISCELALNSKLEARIENFKVGDWNISVVAVKITKILCRMSRRRLRHFCCRSSSDPRG